MHYISRGGQLNGDGGHSGELLSYYDRIKSAELFFGETQSYDKKREP